MGSIACYRANEFEAEAKSLGYDQRLEVLSDGEVCATQILAGSKLPTIRFHEGSCEHLYFKPAYAKYRSASYDPIQESISIIADKYAVSWQQFLGEIISWFDLYGKSYKLLLKAGRWGLPHMATIFNLDDTTVLESARVYFLTGVRMGANKKRKASHLSNQTRSKKSRMTKDNSDDTPPATKVKWSQEDFANEFKANLKMQKDEVPIPVSNITLDSVARVGNRDFIEDFYSSVSDTLQESRESRCAAVNVSVNTSEVSGSIEFDQAPSADTGNYNQINAISLPDGILAVRKPGDNTIRFVAGKRRLTIVDIVSLCKLFKADSYNMVAYVDDASQVDPFGDRVGVIDLTLDRPLLNKVIAHLTGQNLSSKQKKVIKSKPKQSSSDYMKVHKQLLGTKTDDLAFGTNKYVLKKTHKTTKPTLKSKKKRKAPSQLVFKPNSGNIDQSASALKDVEKAVGGEIKPATITLDTAKKTAIVSTKENAKLKRLAGKATQGKLYVMLSGKDIYIVGHDSMTKPELFSELDAAMGRVQVESTAVVASGDKPGLMCRFKTAADAKAVAEALGLEGKQGEIESTNAIENAPEVD